MTVRLLNNFTEVFPSIDTHTFLAKEIRDRAILSVAAFLFSCYFHSLTKNQMKKREQHCVMAAKVAAYVAMDDSIDIFYSLMYCPDIRGTRSSDDVPRRKITVNC